MTLQDSSNVLAEFRKPADTTKLVATATGLLKDLSNAINLLSEDNFAKVLIDTGKIEEIISSLNELNAERLWLHEAVETETINASILRNKLSVFPRDTGEEIRVIAIDAVKAARQSNLNTIIQLKNQLFATAKNVEDLSKRYEILSVGNITFSSEMHEMKGTHDETINKLNRTLLDKASLQIKLNGTKEKLNDIRNRMRDYKEAFTELREDIEAERQETKVEMKRLRQEIASTDAKTSFQSSLNVIKNNELHETKASILNLEAEINRTKEAVKQCENNRVRLENQVKEQSKQLTNDINRNVNLQENSKLILKDIGHINAHCDEKKKHLNKQLMSLVDAVKLAQTEYEVLTAQKVKSSNLLDRALQLTLEDKDNVQEMQKSLRLVKDDLLLQTSKSASLNRKIADLEAVIEQITQDHLATTDYLNKEISTNQNNLRTERNDRNKLQQERELLNNEATEYIIQFNKFALATTKSISEGKLQHKKLNEKGQLLQKNFKEVEDKIKKKQSQLLDAKNSYIKMQKDSNAKIKSLKQNITRLDREILTSNAKYETELPSFLELQSSFEKKMEEADEKKKLIVQLKTKKAELESGMKKAQTSLDAMKTPKIEAQNELSLARKSYLEQLENQGCEMRGLEQSIFEMIQKFNVVTTENERFKQAIHYFEKDISFMADRVHEMTEGKFDIDATINKYKDWLEVQWKQHQDLDKKYYIQDIALLDDIKRVELVTSEREKKVEKIHHQLESELELLVRFIDKVAEIRPKAIVL